MYDLYQFLSNFSMLRNHLRDLVNSADSRSVRLVWGLRFCTSNKLSGDVGTSGPWSTL